MSRKRRESQDPEALRRLLRRRTHTPARHLVREEPEGPTDPPAEPAPPGSEGTSPAEPVGGSDIPVSTTLVLSVSAWKRLAVYCFLQNRTLREALHEVLEHLDDISPDEVRAGERTRKTRRLNVLLPERLHNRLRWTAVKMDVPMNTLVEALIQKILPDPDPELAAAIRRLPRGPKPRR